MASAFKPGDRAVVTQEIRAFDRRRSLAPGAVVELIRRCRSEGGVQFWYAGDGRNLVLLVPETRLRRIEAEPFPLLPESVENWD